MDISNSAAVSQNTDQNQIIERKSGISFYTKLFFLYFLNITDWFCTEALISSGKFYEANPVMRPILDGFWPTVLIKGVLPLALVLLCALIYKLAGSEDSFMANLLLYIGITAYALVNLWHIFNFIMLFFVF